MAFESLSEKLQNVFKNLRGRGRLSENDVKAAMKEVKLALLEADVNFKVVKQFIKAVEERAVGQDVMNSLTPGQQVIKIVNEEMIALMGAETTEITIKPAGEMTVIMMVGLQGAGKTTTAAKLAGKFKGKGHQPLLVGCDIYRPAAIEQLKINGEKQGVPVFTMGNTHSPVDISKAAIEHAKKNKNNIVIIDTAGRLHIDESMMDELVQIKENVNIDYSVLVVDAMTGQDAVNVAKTFDERLDVYGVILTKMDGDTRGGAALSIKSVTGKPILYVGMGEKLSDLEQFYPDRMASRILGMGDILTLIEKAELEYDEEKAKELSKKIKKAEFDFNDFLEQMQQLKKMGGINGLLGMLPGMGAKADALAEVDDKQVARIEAIVLSMSAQERANPSILNPSRKNRIAKGAGVDIAEVNRIVKQFDQMKKMMKSMSGLTGGKKRGGGLGGLMGGKFKLPGGMF
jgi:signal recognition particle protein